MFIKVTAVSTQKDHRKNVVVVSSDWICMVSDIQCVPEEHHHEGANSVIRTKDASIVCAETVDEIYNLLMAK